MKRKGSNPEREFRSAQHRSEEWEEDPVGRMHDAEDEPFEDEEEEELEDEEEDDLDEDDEFEEEEEDEEEDDL